MRLSSSAAFEIFFQCVDLFTLILSDFNECFSHLLYLLFYTQFATVFTNTSVSLLTYSLNFLSFVHGFTTPSFFCCKQARFMMPNTWRNYIIAVRRRNKKNMNFISSNHSYTCVTQMK